MSLTKSLSLALAMSISWACLVGQARAERGETRLSAYAGGSLATVGAFDSSAGTQMFGGGISVAQGLRNWVDVGLTAGYQTRPNTSIEGATLNALGGDERHVLFTDVQVFEATLSARTYLEAGPFSRLRPLVGLHVGMQAALYGDPELFLDHSTPVTGSDSTWDFSLLKGAEIGVAYRMSDLLEATVLLNTSFSDTLEQFGLALEVSWQRI